MGEGGGDDSLIPRTFEERKAWYTLHMHTSIFSMVAGHITLVTCSRAVPIHVCGQHTDKYTDSTIFVLGSPGTCMCNVYHILSLLKRPRYILGLGMTV